MKRALEAFKFFNLSVDEYGSSTRVSADVLCLYKALSYKHLHLQYKFYLCGMQVYSVPYLNMTIPVYGCMLFNVLNVYRFK